MLPPMRTLAQDEALRFAERTDVIWHQRWELAPGVFTSGVSDVAFLMDKAGVPQDLTGLSVLDIGTTNGGLAFEAERRGAARVMALDIVEPSWFAFDALAALLQSEVEFRKTSTYELTTALAGETFDIVLFLGVLYHLRHPLLALDNVRAVTGGTCYLETAVSDWELAPDLRERSLTSFYRRDELAGDSSNWFSPTVAAFEAWTGSAGFDTELIDAWPADAPGRAMIKATPAAGPAEWLGLSYEKPVRATVDH
jgi:tRNA (mo5U34)-methyltransferase